MVLGRSTTHMQSIIKPIALVALSLGLIGCQHTPPDSGQSAVATPKPAASRDPSESWLPGQITSLSDGVTLPFRIEKKFAWGGSATGGVAATHPDTGERFTGTYSAILPSSHGTGRLYSPSTGWATAQTTQRSQTANAIATLKGDKGTVIQLELQIQSGFRPHGIGSGSDNQNRRYQVQF